MHHFARRGVVINPAPVVKFRWLAGGIEIHRRIAAFQAQQEPFLFLPDTLHHAGAAFAAVTHRQAIIKPVRRFAQQGYVRRPQPRLLEQLAPHRLFARFARIDAALRELPGILPAPPPPEGLVALVEQHDTNIKAVALRIENIVI